MRQPKQGDKPQGRWKIPEKKLPCITEDDVPHFPDELNEFLGSRATRSPEKVRQAEEAHKEVLRAAMEAKKRRAMGKFADGSLD